MKLAKVSAGTTNDIEEWAAATAEARALRATVAEQVRELIVSQDEMGSAQLTSRRVRDVIAAERAGDPMVLRGAVIQMVVAGAAWVAALDARMPPHSRPVAA